MGRDQARLEETLGMMNNPDGHIICAVDLIDFDKIAATVKEIVEAKGRINGVINCAGISTTLPLNAISPRKNGRVFQDQC